MILLVALTLSCRGGSSGSSAPDVRSPTTANAPAPPRTTPSSRGYFQVAEVAGRKSTDPACHTLPTTLDCLKLGASLGGTADLAAVGTPARNSAGQWLVPIRIDQQLADRMNRDLHRPLAVVVDGEVPAIVALSEPTRTVFTIILGPGQSRAAASQLRDRLAHLD
jgi:hypothetical protein